MKTIFSLFLFFSFLCMSGQVIDSTSERSKENLILPKSLSVDSLLLETHGIKGEMVEYEPKDSVFLKLYKDVVFSNEKSTIKIWKDGIHVFFDPSVPLKHQKDLMEFANVLSSQIDSLFITQVNSRPKANLLIYYMNNETDYDYEPRIKNSLGGFFLHWNGKQQLYRGALKVNSYNSSKPQLDYEILKYYFFLSLGYFGSSKDVPCESFVSTCSSLRELTKIDLEILMYHYSYGICKGIKLKEFEESHHRNQEILKKNPDAKVYIVHPN